MNPDFLDLQSVEKALRSLSSLTGLSFSLYDSRQRLLLPPLKEDAVLATVRKRAPESYAGFLGEYLPIVTQRRDLTIVQGPSDQYHVFIPVHYANTALTFVAEAFYASPDDFRAVFREKSTALGLSERPVTEWLDEIRVIPIEKAEQVMKHTQAILENLVSTGWEKQRLQMQGLWHKTIINLLSNLTSEASVADIYRMVVDTVIFLFKANTAVILTKKDGHFAPEATGGKDELIVRDVRLSDKSHFIVRANAARTPVTVSDSHELLHSGLSQKITSMSLFPIASGSGFFGFLAIFNTPLDNDALQSVMEFCRLSAYLCSAIDISREYERKSDGLGLVFLKTAKLYFRYREPQLLYDSIVSEAAGLVDAEKCSLMLPDETSDTLRVSAVTGINSWLMESVQVRTGEGIAGKVYEEGMPILIDREEKIHEFASRPKPQYKTLSSLSLPLRIADEVIGVLNLSDKKSGDPFSERDLSVLAPFAAQASILLKLCDCYATSEQMRELSITDSLTGLLNRRYFTSRIEEEQQRAKRYGFSFSLAILDIDDFKLFNDTEGHLAGDHVLRELASIMSGTIRTNDILVRFGGEEFAIIMPQTSKAEAFGVAERVRKNIETLIRPTWDRFPKKRITVSIGLAVYPDFVDTVENLIRNADRALYQAKIQGKNQTVTWNGAVSHDNPSDNPHEGLDRKSLPS